jgi:hypothetical protein
MTTTPEKIAQLRRLHAESTMVAGPHYRKAACEELPGLLDDIEAAQKREQMLREALLEIAQAEVDSYVSVNELCNIARKAIAATEVK